MTLSSASCTPSCCASSHSQPCRSCLSFSETFTRGPANAVPATTATAWCSRCSTYRKIITARSPSNPIASYLALTPNYFCGWFKKATGENFGDVVIRYRMDAAKTMLLHSQKKICDIAGEVGYSEIVSFNRVFKKTVGMTPDQYRKSYREPNAGRLATG